MTEQVSFIIPAYNCAAMVRESVESIVNGNFSSGDELIIVNDGSTDDTSKVLDILKAEYPAIILLGCKKNQGSPVARNLGVASAKNLILFALCSDNILAPGSIHRLKKYLLSSGADVAAFQELHCFRKDKSKVEIKWVFKPGVITLADCLAGSRVPPSSGNYMFTKNSWERAGGYPLVSGAKDTWGFGIRQLAAGCKMVVMPNSFYYHRYGWQSLWVRESRTKNLSLVAFQIIEPFLDRFYDEDVDYMLSHKEDWFFHLEEHPIRVKGSTPGRPGVSFRV